MKSLPMDTHTLARLVNEKYGILLHLHQLSSRQKDLIDSNEISELLALLASKQTFLTQLQAVEDQLRPFHQQDPESRDWPSPAARQQCAHVARQCEALLAEILTVERDSEQMMKRRRDTTAERLNKSATASEARRAYTQSPRIANLQLDVSSEVT